MPNITPLIIAEVTIRQDQDGRYCLNDLHKAAGNEPKHAPAQFFRNEQAVQLIAALDTDMQNCTSPVNAIKGGSQQGTYAVKELVYAYAMWISPVFNLHVIRAYDAVATKPAPISPALLTRMQLIELAMQAEQELQDEKAKTALLEASVTTLEPKAQALDAISSAEGSYCLTDAAKNLQIQPKKLNEWLSQNRWIFRRSGGNWTAYQPRIQDGYLVHKTHTIALADGEEKIKHQVRVTAKGLAKLALLVKVAA